MNKVQVVEMVKSGRLTVKGQSMCDGVSWDIVDIYECKQLLRSIDGDCGVWNELQLDGEVVGEYSEGINYTAITDAGAEIYDLLMAINENDYESEVDVLVSELWDFPEVNEAEKEEARKGLISFLTDLNVPLGVVYPRNFGNEYTLIIGELGEDADELTPEDWVDQYLYDWEATATQDFSSVEIRL